MPGAVSVHSMTGFGTASRTWSGPQGPARVEIEIRSVNARFLEVKVRQPFGGAVDPRLRQRIGKRLGRGRVDVAVHVRRADHDATRATGDALQSLGIEPARLAEAIAAVEAVRLAAEGVLQLTPVNPTELLRLLLCAGRAGPAEPSGDPPPFLDALLDEALDAMVAFRAEEGIALAAALSEHAATLRTQLAALTATLPPEVERLTTRVRDRIAVLSAKTRAEDGDPLVLDADRIAHEVAVVLSRGDVTEELDRIASHLGQVDQVLASEAASGQGKTLEFLCQELLREITTIGSKITSHGGSRIVIEAKGTLERIREQVSNVQ